MKAASTAMGLIFRHPEKAGILAPLSQLAREELELLQHHEAHLAALEAARDTAQDEVRLVARRLSERRSEAAAALGSGARGQRPTR